MIRTMRERPLMMIALLLAVALVAAGCGATSTGTGEGPTASGDPMERTAPPETDDFSQPFATDEPLSSDDGAM